MSETTREFDFDVALSYAGEDRVYVETLATRLGERGVRAFYDQDRLAEMWGEDLYTYLDRVYRERARYAIVFISHHYVEKVWTNHERRSAQARALQQQAPYVLPVRLDDTELPGLPPTVGYVDLRMIGIAELAEMVVAKVAASAPEQGIPAATRVPRSPAEIQRLLRDRPSLWEYMLFAGSLLAGLRRLDPKIFDHRLRYVQPSAVALEEGEVWSWFSRRLNQVSDILGVITAILSEEATTEAFGAPGVSGDESKIRHLADRVVDTFRQALDWAADVRSTSVPAAARELRDALAAVVDQPIADLQTFVETVVREVDTLTERLAIGEEVQLELTLRVTTDPIAMAKLDEARARFAERREATFANRAGTMGRAGRRPELRVDWSLDGTTATIINFGTDVALAVHGDINGVHSWWEREAFRADRLPPGGRLTAHCVVAASDEPIAVVTWRDPDGTAHQERFPGP